MAVLSILTSALICYHPSSPGVSSNHLASSADTESWNERRKRAKRSRILVVGAHTNPKILKNNRKSRYGQPFSPYDSEEDDDDDEDQDVGDDEDWFSDEDVFRQSRSSHASKTKQELNFQKASKKRQGRRIDTDTTHDANDRYHLLLEDLDLDEGCVPLLDYLSSFGLKDSHFTRIHERHMPALQINIVSARERLNYLLSVGVKPKDMKKIIMRQPQILEYTVESNLKSHVAFLASLGIPVTKIGHVVAATPSIFSYSVENSLKPTVRYLLEEVGIKKSNLSKVVQLSPQILVQRIESSWNTRLSFLTKELGAPKENIVKMVTKHPQLLHYSIEDGLLLRINFLRSIGLDEADILKVLTSLTQVFSLSLEKNLKPKYMYLINELRNEPRSLTKYPMYLSLSLDQRIRPRHKFLVSLKKAPKGPFPLSSLVPTDACFCQQWAGTSVDKYLDFRQRLLLKDFATKYVRH